VLLGNILPRLRDVDPAMLGLRPMASGPRLPLRELAELDSAVRSAAFVLVAGPATLSPQLAYTRTRLVFPDARLVLPRNGMESLRVLAVHPAILNVSDRIVVWLGDCNELFAYAAAFVASVLPRLTGRGQPTTLIGTVTNLEAEGAGEFGPHVSVLLGQGTVVRISEPVESEASPETESQAKRRDTEATAFEQLAEAERLSVAGQYDEARRATEAAVAAFRRLAADDPGHYEPALAEAMGALSVRLAHLGQTNEALAAAQETVPIYRRLAATEPAVYRPELADSLISLGNRYSEVGRAGEALGAAEEAVAVYRELAAASPDRYRPGLAQSLTNLADVLAALGQHADADAARYEAAEFHQEPDA
jgi:tetratricopeptide (TPR) repeat protein